MEVSVHMTSEPYTLTEVKYGIGLFEQLSESLTHRLQMQCNTLHSILMSAEDVFPTASGHDHVHSASAPDPELRFILGNYTC